MFLIFLLAVLIPRACVAHSWVEQLSLIGANGSFTGAYGYPRGYVSRTDPTFNGFSDNYLIPQPETGRLRANAEDYLCHPAQRVANQTSKYPALRVAPGSAIAMKYLENGHVSLPQNQKGKPEHGGTVFVYGTDKPRDDERITEVLKWTSDGTGGDGRGRLIASNDFDDQRCYQINSGAISTQRQQEFPDPTEGQPSSRNEQWCETDVVLPTSLSIGSYTLYWVWDWPTLGRDDTHPDGYDPSYLDGKDEFYTSCADVQVLTQLADAPVSNELDQQDPQLNAVSNYRDRKAIAPTPDAVAPNPSAGGLGAGSSTTAWTSYTASPDVTGHERIAQPIIPETVAQPSSLGISSASTSSQLVSGHAASTAQVLTALVTVVATLQPGQAGLIVQGQHVVTFVNPDIAAVATTAASSQQSFGQVKNRRSSAFQA